MTLTFWKRTLLPVGSMLSLWFLGNAILLFEIVDTTNWSSAQWTNIGFFVAGTGLLLSIVVISMVASFGTE